MMNEKAKQLLDKLETLGERSDLWHEDFWMAPDWRIYGGFDKT